MRWIDEARRWANRYPAAAWLLAIGCILRGMGLGWRSLWLDEAKTLIVATAPLSQTIELVRGLEGIPPLYYLVIHFWLPLFPADPATAIRVFSALCGIASLPLFFILCRWALGPSYRFAFFLGCLSSYWINMSQDGRTYGLFLFLSLVHMLAALSIERRWSRPKIAVYGIVSLMGLYTHIYFPFFLLAQFFYIFWRLRQNPGKWIQWALVHAVLLVLFLPWILALRIQMSRPDTMLIGQPMSLRMIAETAGTMMFHVSLWAMVFGDVVQKLGYLLLAGVAVGIGLRIWKKNAAALDAPWVFCLMHMVVPLAAVRAVELALHRYIGLPRYFVFMSPCFYIVIARLLGGKSAVRMVRWVVAVLVVASTAAYFASAQIDTRLDRLAVRLRQTTDSRGVILHAQAYAYLPLRAYYLTERPQYLLCPDRKIIDWRRLPGYSVAISPAALRRLEQCVVIDPVNRMSGKVYGFVSCRDAANYVCR